MNHRKVGLLAIAFSAGLAACGEDSTGPSDSLSEAEAQAVAQVLLSQTFEAGDPSSAGPGAVAAQYPVASAPVEFGSEGDITLPCPLGGSLAVARSLSGTFDDETGELSFDFSLTSVHQQCAVQPEELEDVLVLSGAPNLASTLELDQDAQGAVTVAGSIIGAVGWELGDRAGTCEVSVNFSGTGTAEGSASNAVSGSVCGVQFSEESFVGPVS